MVPAPSAWVNGRLTRRRARRALTRRRARRALTRRRARRARPAIAGSHRVRCLAVARGPWWWSPRPGRWLRRGRPRAQPPPRGRPRARPPPAAVVPGLGVPAAVVPGLGVLAVVVPGLGRHPAVVRGLGVAAAVVPGLGVVALVIDGPGARRDLDRDALRERRIAYQAGDAGHACDGGRRRSDQ